MFRSRKPKVEADPMTGEIKPQGKSNAWYSDDKLVAKPHKISELTPGRPRYLNLRDHPEMDGKTIEIRALSFEEGEFGPYVKIGCFVVGTEKYPAVIMTGAEDIYTRCLAVEDIVSAGEAVIGTLHSVGKAGQAWILD